MSEVQNLTASPRERVGKGAARAARREGLVPAVIYGDKKAPQPIALNFKEVHLRILAGGFLKTVFEIEVDGKKSRVIPRDYQVDPIKDMPVHVDFLRIAKGATVTVEVPVHFINEDASPGIKRGGVLNIVRHAVEVTCPADAIPDAFEADLTGLEINDSIHISAIELPDNVQTTITDRDFTVATVAAPAVLEEPSEEEEAEAAEASEGEEGEGAEDEGEESEDKAD